VLDAFQNRGYATEAVQGMIPVIFSHTRISRIMATTFPELKASIRVLEKTGFACTGPTLAGDGLEEGTLGIRTGTGGRGNPLPGLKLTTA